MSLLTQFYPGPGGGGGGGISNAVAAGVAGFITSGGSFGFGDITGGFTGGTATGNASQTINPWSLSTKSGAPPVATAQPFISMDGDCWTRIDLVNYYFNAISNTTLSLQRTKEVGGGSYRAQAFSLDISGPSLTKWENGVFVLSGTSSSLTFTAPNLADVSTCVFAGVGTGWSFNFSGCSLNVASVTKIIETAAATETFDPFWGGSINFSGGSNATLSSLSPATQALVTSLNANGWTITITP